MVYDEGQMSDTINLKGQEITREQAYVLLDIMREEEALIVSLLEKADE